MGGTETVGGGGGQKNHQKKINSFLEFLTISMVPSNEKKLDSLFSFSLYKLCCEGVGKYNYEGVKYKCCHDVWLKVIKKSYMLSFKLSCYIIYWAPWFEQTRTFFFKTQAWFKYQVKLHSVYNINIKKINWDFFTLHLVWLIPKTSLVSVQIIWDSGRESKYY